MYFSKHRRKTRRLNPLLVHNGPVHMETGGDGPALEGELLLHLLHQFHPDAGGVGQQGEAVDKQKAVCRQHLDVCDLHS